MDKKLQWDNGMTATVSLCLLTRKSELCEAFGEGSGFRRLVVPSFINVLCEDLLISGLVWRVSFGEHTSSQNEN